MRTELEPNLEFADRIYPLVLDLISEFDDAFDSENTDKQKKAINKIAGVVKKEVSESDIYEYWGYISKEDLAYQFLIPDPQKTVISKEELVEILKNRVFEGDKTFNFYTILLKKCFAHPNPLDLSYSLDDASLKKVADEIINYKPILL